ncbi:hypothetical protein JRQ81_006392 [Phrynocephalus forsythii]|uniref:C-factor-like n=1 Tax=Phrynocephalus forsythii TaxID=171643 RepID=A0A9Q1AUR8_9SAUR|nr:hypothetical protein JRQ81_006392 [Phrynocephalus forsythii]
MEDFRVRSVLVTGADRGIGLGLVQQFMNLPHPPGLIFATCRHPDGTKGQGRAPPGAHFTPSSSLGPDVTDTESIRGAAQKVREHLKGRGLNLLINNAGIACDTTLDSETAETMRAVYDTNTVGPMRVSQAFFPLLQTAALWSSCPRMSCIKAAIINLSSCFGSLSTLEEWQRKQVVGYRCSKAALNMLTRCQARGYGCWGILCISLHPGGVKTGLDAEEEVLSVASSTQAILQVLARLSTSDNGCFLDWRGQVVPW